MKRRISFLLALVLALSLCAPVHAASGLVFDLSCEGSQFDSNEGINWLTGIKKGDTIEVSFRISANPAVNTISVWNELYFDKNFFEMVSCSRSDAAKSTNYSNPSWMETRAGKQYALFETMITSKYQRIPYSAEPVQIGTVKLKVIASGGQSTISSTNCSVYDGSGNKCSITTQDLAVYFGNKSPHQWSIYFNSDGGEPVNDIILVKGQSATLPSATKLYHEFAGWKLDDGTHYDAGTKVTPEGDLWLIADWIPVPAPAAPSGISTQKATDPDIHDGVINGVTSAMEYSSDAKKWTTCPDGSITGLASGKYYVRLKENPSGGTFGTPAGEAATVIVEAGPRADAPTGLEAIKESLAGENDGRITGTTSAMEYSLSETFAAGVMSCGNGTTTGLTGGTYYVRYAKTATRGYSKTAEVTVYTGKRPAAPTAPKSVSTSLKGVSDGKITGLTTAMEYSTNGKSWTDCPNGELTDLKAGDTYYIRWQKDDATNTAASEYTAIVIGEGGLRDAPASVSSVQTSRPSAADGKLVGTTASMEYSANETNWKPCTGSEVTGLKAGTYYVRLKAEGDLPAGNSTAVVVNPGQVPAPAAPTGFTTLQESLSGAKDGRILGVNSTMEYSADGEKWTSCTGTAVTGLSAGSYFVRLKANPSTEAPAGASTEVHVRSGSVPAAPSGLVCVPPGRPGKSDGVIAGTTAKMEWSTNEKSSKWTVCGEGETVGFAAGTYYFRYQADAATNTVAGEYATIVVKDPEFILDDLNSRVEVSASVSGSTATVKSLNSEQLEEALFSGYVELDLSDLGKHVDSVKLPGNLFVKAADDDYPCAVAITLSSAIIDFDAEAVASIAKQSSGKEIALSLTNKDASKLNAAQTEAIKSLDVSLAFEISLGAGKQITDFGDGTAAIGIPFTVPSGKLAEGYSVWHIAEDGKAERISAAYSDGLLCFIVPHFSDYVVVYEKPVTLNFTDVLPNNWFYDNVKNAYAMGLIEGKTATTFNPNDNMTWAEAVTLAARMNERYRTGSVTLKNAETGKWYESYETYAIEKGILSEKLGNKANTSISRKDYVDIFYNALPMEAYAEKNSVTNIPDLVNDTTNAKIYTFYKAGILTGYANTPGKVDGAFGPNDNIKRSEVATILIRMMDAGTRVSFTL